jgi:haloalkane dehalogenase
MRERKFSVDAAEYPFQSRWFERNGSAMHYIDEGQGEVEKIAVVMCHGNPTWSYLYRHIIKMLAPQYRCIAYDLPGFGYSDHPPGYSYLPQEHAEWVEALLLEHLKLDRFILVVQDWGGPIGLRIATRHPDKIIGVVISSTFIGAPTTVGKIFSTLMGTWLGQYLIIQRNFFAKTIVSAMLGKRATPATLKAYVDPFPTPDSRKGPAVFPVQIVGATPWLEETKSRLQTLAGKPIEFVFGLKDIGTRAADIAAWLNIFPRAGVQKVAEANHFTQEDCPENYVVAVNRIAAQAEQRI